jgi:hypothetical protein
VVYRDVTRQAKGLYHLKHVGALWSGLAYLSRYNSGWFCHIRREWKRLEAEHLQLSDWEHRLGDRIKTVSARYLGERAELALGRELLQEQLQEALDREAVATQRERAAARWEKHATEQELVAETRVKTAADREKTALELANQAKGVVQVTKEQEAALAEREAAAAEREKRLAAHEEEEVARLEELQEREAAVEEELRPGPGGSSSARRPSRRGRPRWRSSWRSGAPASAGS